jgi:hypothetical protein
LFVTSVNIIIIMTAVVKKYYICSQFSFSKLKSGGTM